MSASALALGAAMLVALMPGAAARADVRWLRPMDGHSPCRWGIDGGVQFAVWPSAVGGDTSAGGPRGLIRVGYPVLPPDNAVSLINFIAVEPIVRGKGRGFSELEPSATDNQPGRMIWPAAPDDAVESGAPQPYAGKVTHPDPGRPDVEQLTVRLNVERFANGAHVYLLASIRSDHPDLLELHAFAAPDSAPLSECILTATMGNFERLRLVQLRDRVVSARVLYSGYHGDGFAEGTEFQLADLARTPAGDVVVSATPDEADPAATVPDPNQPGYWHYAGRKVTQFWLKRAGSFDGALRVKVNARRVYWASHFPIPGGVAFENFELVEPFRPGERLWFGITPRTPEELLQGKGL
jgi:hypothetical protein